MPTQESDTGQQASPTERRHTNPRRVSPANSITLRHHRLAREASERRSNRSYPGQNASANGSPPRQNSSGDSHETTASDPKKWFDQSNQNPTATYSNAMDVDPPFFQRESDSSNEDPSLLYPPPRPNMLGRGTAQSSSADDYRSVIDDLTVEIQKLKEELKHYKQQGPDMLRKDKLFEIKVHGLPRRKKRELESTLRDFAAGLPGSPQSSSRNVSRRAIVHSGSGSKHASSSSGSNARPVDSAYASMSTGANSSGTSLGKSSMRKAAKASEQKVESYLRDIPEGLYPRHMAMTDKERKKIVVRRLEQLFTGKINGLNSRQNRFAVPPTTPVITEIAPPSHAAECSVPQSTQKTVHHPPNLLAEPSREARILRSDRQHGHRKKSGSGDNGSASNSNGDQTESGGNGNGNGSGSGSGNGASSGSGTNASPPDQTPPEQRPTRPKDLDPDRVQVPSENMAYIRHLGLVPPDLLPDIPQDADVSPDAEGWVYLNLLCNLAQLHMINVTPSFVRSAVSEISTKFQLSPDGRKIRWRGGTEGTKLSSESSVDSSEKSPQTDDTDAIQDGVRKKRQKTGRSTEESAGTSSKQNSKFGPQVSTSSKKFHYKPLFVRQDSSRGEVSMDDTLSSFGPVEESNVGGSGWGQSGSGGTSNRKKRRHDGAIIYYSGAPFCTDLSGDTGDASPATYMTSSGQDQETMETSTQSESRPLAIRSTSGSTLDHRPLSIANFSTLDYKMDIDNEDIPGIISDTGDNSTGSEMDFPWSEGQQYLDIHPLEPCGLGGVLPDDHFMVVVTTKRPKEDAQLKIAGSGSTDVTDNIICRLATMSTSSPAPMLPSRKPSTSELLPTRELEIEYTSGRIKRLNPVPLPPPAIFFPPFSSGSSASEADDIMLAGDDDSDFEDSSSQELVSRQANPHHSDGYPDGHLSSGDEDGEDLDAEAEERMLDIGVTEGGLVMDPLSRLPGQSIGSEVVAPGTARGGSRSISLEAAPPNDSSSAATAGKAGSDADSSSESS